MPDIFNSEYFIGGKSRIPPVPSGVTGVRIFRFSFGSQPASPKGATQQRRTSGATTPHRSKHTPGRADWLRPGWTWLNVVVRSFTLTRKMLCDDFRYTTHTIARKKAMTRKIPRLRVSGNILEESGALIAPKSTFPSDTALSDTVPTKTRNRNEQKAAFYRVVELGGTQAAMKATVL